MRSLVILLTAALATSLAAAEGVALPNEADRPTAAVPKAGAEAKPAARTGTNANAGSMTFRLDQAKGTRQDRTFTVALRCDDTVILTVELSGDQPEQTRDHDAVGRTCVLTHRSSDQPERTDEVSYEIHQDADALARRVTYSDDGTGRSTEFVLPKGSTTTDLRVESLSSDQVGVPVRAMALNVWGGGSLDGEPEGERNFEEMIEFLRAEDPDILFMVETYGAGDRIVERLNEGRPADRHYTGERITREPGQDPDRDNLWLFTRFDVETVYPRRGNGDLTSFNFGGARLRLPNGQRLHAFPTWLHHTDWAWGTAHRAALDSALGLPPEHTEQEVIDTDQRRRVGMVRTLLEDRLPEYLGTDPEYADAPVLIAGDFNTMSHLDWTERFADARGHGGLVLPWPATRMFTDAGFTDTFRWANPDAARFPGRTWSTYHGWGYAPARIDYLLARGEQVRVLSSYTRTERLPEQRDSELAARYPFYSDHGAVVSDLLIRGDGNGPDREPVFESPSPATDGWDAEPTGRPIGPDELSASASSSQDGWPAGHAVDGDITTTWHSQYSPAEPHPHDVTIDTGKVRTLTGLRYHPRVEGNANGTVRQATVQVSSDGENFTDVASVRWEADSFVKPVELDEVSARYIRLHIEAGSIGQSTAAEITPYEKG